MQVGTPRIQARTGQITDPPELVGKWTFEIHLTYIGGGEDKKVLQCPAYFETEAEAKTAMREAARVACEACEKMMGSEVSGNYLDLKSNAVRKWDET